jgi:hypothetical protein
MQRRATCRNCAQTITRHPSGIWSGGKKDSDNGMYCQESATPESPRIKHEPMPEGLKGEPEWVE